MEAEELIAAIVAAPDDDEPWLVYTDWLLDRGDPRGELMSLQAAVDAEDPAAIWRLRAIENDEDALLSPRLWAEAKHWRFEWKRGFMKSVELVQDAGPPSQETVLALCADPHAALLDRLDVDLLASIHITDPRPICDVGDCDPGLAQLTRLRSLELRGVRLSSLRHEQLRELSTDTLACPALVTGAFSLPRLESLSVLVADDLFAARRSILRDPPTALRSLYLGQANGNTIPALAPCRVLDQLRSIDLDGDPLAALAALRDNPAPFAHLESIGCGFGNAGGETADDETVAQLRASLEQRFPTTNLQVIWEHLVHHVPFDPDPEPEPPPVDDALAAWRREFIKP